MRTLNMSPMVGNGFSRCLGTTIVPPISRVPALTHAHGRVKLTLSNCEHLQLTAVLTTNVSAETSSRRFTSLRRNRVTITCDTGCKCIHQVGNSHSSLASVDLTMTEAKIAKQIAEILERGEYEKPNFKVSDFEDVHFAMHPLTKVLNKHVKDWQLKHDLQTCFESIEAFENFHSELVHNWPLGFYNEAPVGRAAWCCYVCQIFFIFDDVVVDDSPDGHKPEFTIPPLFEMFLSMLWSFPQGFRSDVHKFLDYLNHVPEKRRQTEELIDKTISEAILLPGTEYPYKLSPMGSAFREMWMMAVRESNPEFMQQFGTMFLEALFGVINDGMKPGLSFDKFPTYEDYMEKRSNSIGVRAWCCMTGYAYDVPIPDEIFYSPNVQQMVKETSFAAGILSDIYSTQIDLECPKLNGLIVLANDLNCSLVEATNEVKKKLFKYNENMLALKATIEAETSPVHLPAVQIFIKVCFSIFGSSMDYYRRTSRYPTN